MNQELTVIVDPKSEKKFFSVISFNNKELKEKVTQLVAKYKDLVCTPDNVKAIKEDRALLNASREALDKVASDIRKKCLAPYEDFKTKTDEVKVIITEAHGNLDKQVKDIEAAAKDAKQKEIGEFYTTIAAPQLPLEKIFNLRWLNATVTMKTAKKELTDAVNKFKADLDIIDKGEGKFKAQIKDRFMQTLDISAALAYGQELEAQEKKYSEPASVPAPKAEIASTGIPAAATPAPVTYPEISEDAELVTVKFSVTTTVENFAALKNFFTENNINYSKIQE